MSHTPSPAPPSSSPTPESPTHALLHGIWQGITQTASTHPWVLVVLGLIVLTGIVRSVRVAIHSGPRDPVRRFTRADKQLLLTWAGHRCEHHGWLTGRCRATEKLEADHVHPHSRGGWTNISNGQILCQQHNRAKNAGIPWDRSLRRLAERRSAYYPTSVDRAVVRRRPRKVNQKARSSDAA